MGIGYVYRRYFKNNVFLKIVLVFSLITIGIIIAFSYLMYRSVTQSGIQRELDTQARAMDSVSRFIGGKYESVQAMMMDLYRSDRLASDLSFLLNHSYDSYLKHQLDQYSVVPAEQLETVLDYWFNKLDADNSIRNIVLYSSERQALYTIDENKNFKIAAANAARSYVPDVMASELKNVTAPNVWVNKAIGRNDDAHLFTVRVPINDKQSLKNIGQLIVYFSADKITDALDGYKDLKGSILVRDSDGTVFYDSAGWRYGQHAEEEEQAASLDGQRFANDVFINKLSSGEGGYAVIGEASREEMTAPFNGTRNTIIVVCLICIAIATVIPSLFIMNFAKRTNEIIRLTRKVKNGDLSARIDESREDELGQISRSFNSMLDELNEYIDKVYKAEINQKHAELSALQARVNPHFLYNTLEVIRMRAFSQGDNDAAEMVYSLSILFKNLVNPKRQGTMQSELEACKLYLELFRIRYKSSFAYEIDCPAELLQASIPRLTLQPIVENYIVHGMDQEKTDNRLTIRVRQEETDMQVHIEDNGIGIHPDKLIHIRQLLDKEDEESFGLRSVHARLNLLYGKPYGLNIRSTLGAGTAVTVTLPNTGRESRQYA